MTHRLSSGKYARLLRRRMVGMWDGKDMWVDPTLRRRDELKVAVHECLHAEYPDMKEKHVTRVADSVARLLWKMGYRKRRK